MPARELHKLTQRLEQINVLVADADTQMAALTVDILRLAGFSSVCTAKNYDEVIACMNAQETHLVITDWLFDGARGENIMRTLRTDPNSPDRYVPIILLTGRAEKSEVELARSSGITEFMVKPFTPETLFKRIVAIVEQPRDFIVARSYVGPDRRRRSESIDGPDRRRGEGDSSVEHVAL